MRINLVIKNNAKIFINTPNPEQKTDKDNHRLKFSIKQNDREESLQSNNGW